MEQDEEKWDEAIKVTVDNLQEGDGISKNEKGETVLKLIASIAVAEK